ncbi:MAG: hypothetical protein MUF15_17390 [Acidobacteria bacterium]|nr:hypothetical protein [Acidobacteriota bacterium]
MASIIGAAAIIIAAIIPSISSNCNKHKPSRQPKLPVVIEERQVTDTEKDLPGSEKQEKNIVTLNVDPIVYKAITGTCYHNENCGYLKGRKIPVRLNEAKALKLKSCKRCKPPE